MYVSNEGLSNLCFSDSGRKRLEKIYSYALSRRKELPELIDGLNLLGCFVKNLSDNGLLSEQGLEKNLAFVKAELEQAEIELVRVNNLIREIEFLTNKR